MSDPIVSLGTRGRLRGVQSANGVRRFLGIPYALPPVGELRWRKPQPLSSSFSYDVGGSPRDCTEFGNVCPQEMYVVEGKPFNEYPGVKYSEDCLLLNIWAPGEAPPEGESWPVLAFIHGGWLQIGQPSVVDEYHPHELIAEDGAGLKAIVVSIGYRLNVFGFLAGAGFSGNYGLWDQRMALEWIQDNISHFGGDPTRVTLMGHSAGGFSAHVQLQYEILHTNGSRPLFKNVFLCSNAIPAQPKTVKEARAQLENLCEVLGITTYELATALDDYALFQLKQATAAQLVAALPKLKMSNFRAVTDGDMIHFNMMEKFKDGTFAGRFKDRGYRLMIGETETEQFLYSQFLPPKDAFELPTKLQNYYAAGVCEKLMAHPGYQQYDSVVEKFSRMVSDMQVRAPIRVLCRQLLEAGVPPERILRYRAAFRPGFFDKYYPPEAGVTHGADLYVWWAGKTFGYTDEEWEASKQWLSETLFKLVKGEPFDQGDVRSYKLLGPEGVGSRIDDPYWDHLMSVMDSVSK